MVLTRSYDPFSPNQADPERTPETSTVDPVGSGPDPADGRQDDAEDQKPPAEPEPAPAKPKRALRRKTPDAPKTSRRARRAPDKSTDVDAEIADLLGEDR